jgi:hypothetical protein
MAEKQQKPSKNEELVEVAKQVAALWMDFRNNLRKAFSSQEIAPEEDRHFLDVKSHLSRLQRVLSQRLPEGSRWGSKRMTELMQQSISIATLRDMPMQDKKTLYEQWHGAYISLENLLGVLDVILEGYPVNFQATEKKSGNIKAQMNKERQGKAKKASGSVGLVLISLVLIGIAVWYTWFRK